MCQKPNGEKLGDKRLLPSPPTVMTKARRVIKMAEGIGSSGLQGQMFSQEHSALAGAGGCR